MNRTVTAQSTEALFASYRIDDSAMIADANTSPLALDSVRQQRRATIKVRKQIKGDLSDFGLNETQYDDFTSHLNPASDVDFEGVMASAVFNSLVFVVLMVSYEILRRLVPSVYASKTRQAAFRGERRRSSSALSLMSMDEEEDPSNINESHSRKPASIGFSLPLDWVLPVYKVPWNKVLKDGGLDAYMFLRYIRLCLRITSVSAFWGIIILWPVYANGAGPYGELSWYHFSMANVDQGSWRIWVPTVFIYLFSAYIFFAMRQEYKHYVELRMDYLGEGGTGDRHGPGQDQQTYSVMVERIPSLLRSDQGLFDYFNHLFPGKVHSACVILSAPDLEATAAKVLDATRRLEKSIAYFYATGQRRTHIIGRPRINVLGIDIAPFELGVCKMCHGTFDMDAAEEEGTTPPRGVVVDSTKYFTRELAQVNQELWAAQRKKAKIAEMGSSIPMGFANAWIEKLADCTKQVGDDIMDESMEINVRSGGKRPKSRTDDFNGSLIERSYSHYTYGTIDEELAPLNWNSDDDSVDVPHSGSGEDTHAPHRAAAKTCAFGRRLAGMLGLDFFVSFVRLINKRLSSCFSGCIPKSAAAGTTTSSTGFVTLFFHHEAAVAACASLTHKPNALEVTPAPDNREILWDNAAVGVQRRRWKAIVANVLLFFGVIFWSIPLAAIQAFAKIDEIAQIPGMEWIVNVGRGNMAHFINDYLPVVALLTLIMILPFVFEWIAVSYERRKTMSDVQDSIVGRYFYYQVANIYVTVTAGSIWAALADILDQPAALLQILGESIPMMVGYFLSLLITKILAGLPMVILRGGALSRMFLLRTCFNRKKLTQRELDEVYRKEPLYFGWEYPTQMLVIMIAFAYAYISPVILPVAAAYFLGALIVYKKQVLYVYTATYEGGGRLFPVACDKTLVGLIISQLTFIGYSLIRKGQRQPLFLFPLPFITKYMIYYFREHYATPSTKLSLERAIELDHVVHLKTADKDADESEASQVGKEKLAQRFKEEYYRQPVLTLEAGRPMPYRREKGVDELTATALKTLQASVSRFQIMTDEAKQGVQSGSSSPRKNRGRRRLDV